MKQKQPPYRLKIERHVRRQIDQLPGHIRQRARRLIAELAFDPHPAHAEELTGILAGRYKIKINDYRIVYIIEEEIITVEVLKVGHKHGPEFYQDI